MRKIIVLAIVLSVFGPVLAGEPPSRLCVVDARNSHASGTTRCGVKRCTWSQPWANRLLLSTLAKGSLLIVGSHAGRGPLIPRRHAPPAPRCGVYGEFPAKPPARAGSFGFPGIARTRRTALRDAMAAGLMSSLATARPGPAMTWLKPRTSHPHTRATSRAIRPDDPPHHRSTKPGSRILDAPPLDIAFVAQALQGNARRGTPVSRRARRWSVSPWGLRVRRADCGGSALDPSGKAR